MRIGVGLSIPELATRGGRFSPASLFTGGVAGAWYDPSDYSTLFQDSAGTTPVTAVEQPVGLMLDKSQGLVLGPQLITNGDFSNGTTSWTPNNATLAVASNELEVTVTTASSPSALQDFSTVVGMTYEVTGTIRAPSANTTVNAARIVISTPSVVFAATSEDVSIPVRFVFVATLTTTRINLQVASSGAFGAIGDKAYFDNISVKLIPGNHASQSTSTSRPVLRARYNLLTYSEQFDNAAWSKSGLNTTGTPAWVNAAVAPDGTTTADFLIPQATTANHSINSVASVTVAGVNTFSVYAKAGGYNYLQMLYGSGTDYANFNLTGAGSVSQNSGGAPTIVAVGNGWYRCTITSTFAGATTVYLQPVPTGTETRYATYLGDNASGVYVWGADLRTGSSAGTYQRIAAATDYATAGFLPYLAFDGTDDSFGTNSINFSATDKMSVCAGVTKLSDAALGMIIELSANANSNNGTFLICGPALSGGGPQYGMVTRGNISASAAGYLPTTYSAPITNTVTTLFNLAGTTKAEVVIPRINGVVDQGEPDANALNNGGTFLSYPLYIGRRNNASFPFNGRIYGLIVAGKTLSASELSATESWMAAKTGVTL